MRKTQTFCDVCKEEKIIENLHIQTIFITEQTEGRNCKPYLNNDHIDICKECLDKVLKGNYLWGHGAQGHNHYSFKE